MRIAKLILKFIPTFLLSLFLALIVWALAVTSADPNEEKVYPNVIDVRVVGLDENLVLVSQTPEDASLTLSAPSSLWNQLNRDSSLIHASIDVTGLGVGEHNVPISVELDVVPVKIINIAPRSVTVVIDTYLERELPVTFEVSGHPSVGFEADTPTLSVTQVTVKGPTSVVERVAWVKASLDISESSQSFVTTLDLEAFDVAGRRLTGITIEPGEVTVDQPITQKYGYRNLVVKVVVAGQVADGYRVTNISAYPAVVTVYSADPDLVADLPGYLETEPLDITGMKDDQDVYLPLALPNGVSMVGENLAQVQVGIAAIESSLTLSDMQVEFTGLEDGWSASVSPELVDVILSGPLPVLDSLRLSDVRVFIDVTDVPEGTYQRVPQVEMLVQGLWVESILPESVEVILTAPDEPTIGYNGFMPARTPTPRP